MTLVNVLFGFLLGLIPGWFARKRRLKSHWAALSAEIDLCKEKCEAYTGLPKIIAPLYRMPLDGFRNSFPVLLAEGALKEHEVKILSKFYGQAEDINRGLDRVANMGPSLAEINGEYNRNLAKARELIEDSEQSKSFYRMARQVVNEHL
jgi:hypothetical protein